ncbi:MAG: YdcF family protein [Parasporobacterium sp.]|nr:YdcF family protein [Parasporobacterium sp.]
MEEKKKLKIIPVKQMLLFVISGVLLVFSVANIITPGMNSAEYIVYFVNLCVLLYAVFYDKCQQLFAHGILRVIRIIWRSVFAILLAMAIFMNIVSQLYQPDGTEKGIIVLGAPVSYTDSSRILDSRAMTAVTVANVYTDVPIILSGGGPTKEAFSEADYMAAVMVFYNVPAERLIVESNSMTTAENFINTATVLKSENMSLDDPYLVITSSFHCYRVMEYARAAGFKEIHFMPVLPDLQDIPAWYLRECIAIVNYWITGK